MTQNQLMINYEKHLINPNYQLMQQLSFFFVQMGSTLYNGIGTNQIRRVIALNREI